MSTAIPDKIGHVGETISWTVDLFIEPLGFIGADYSIPCGDHIYKLGTGTGASWVEVSPNYL